MQTFSPTTVEAMAETHEPHHNEVVGMTTQLSNYCGEVSILSFAI
jgi:hypothetical protein